MAQTTAWDTSGAFWDSGMFWDASLIQQGDVQPYLNLITSEYNQQPNFMTMIAAVLQPLADAIASVSVIPTLYDLDTATGAQEDTVGLWIGASRNVAVPLTGVFFSWGIDGLGWGEGVWHEPGTPTDGLVSLNDEDYRTLLRAVAAANVWDGTIPGAYDAWNTLFAGTGIGILIQDFQDMSIGLALTGPVPSAVQRALFTGGYLSLVSAGVRVRWYATPSVPMTPYFAWGIENANLAGWGEGAWPNFTPGM
jgi:hypothetical protein